MSDGSAGSGDFEELRERVTNNCKEKEVEDDEARVDDVGRKGRTPTPKCLDAIVCHLISTLIFTQRKEYRSFIS